MIFVQEIVIDVTGSLWWVVTCVWSWQKGAIWRRPSYLDFDKLINSSKAGFIIWKLKGQIQDIIPYSYKVRIRITVGIGIRVGIWNKVRIRIKTRVRDYGYFKFGTLTTLLRIFISLNIQSQMQRAAGFTGPFTSLKCLWPLCYTRKVIEKPCLKVI